MDFYGDYYYRGGFEPFEISKKPKKKSKKKKKFFKKVKKFFRKLRDKFVDTVLSTFSQITLLFFDKKFEKVFA